MSAAPAPVAPPAAPAATISEASIARTRSVAVGALLALVALGLAWELWLAPTGRGTLALKVLPLALALPGLLKNRMYTHRWLSLVVWLYVTEGLVRATSEAGVSQACAVLEIVLCLVLFAACGAHVRWRLKRAKQLGLEPSP